MFALNQLGENISLEIHTPVFISIWLDFFLWFEYYVFLRQLELLWK